METYDVSKINTNRSTINNILSIAAQVKCNYPDTSIHQQQTLINYHSFEDLTNAISNSDNLMDCSSVLLNILLQHYLQPSIFTKDDTILNRILDKYKDRWNLMFIRETIKLQLETNHLGKLLYLEYKPFYHLEDYFNKNLIKLSTNNMGWWLLGLGKTCEVIINANMDIKNMWYGSQDLDKQCYLSFLGNSKTTHNNGMIICNLDTIYHILVNDAKKDWNNMIDSLPEQIDKQATSGIMNIILKQNDITMETVYLHYMNSLFLEDNSHELEDFSSLIGNLGNNLANGFIPENVDITPKNNIIPKM